MLINNNDTDQIANFFSWETDFDAILAIDDVIYPNTYNIRMSFLPKVTDIKLQNNSFERYTHAGINIPRRKIKVYGALAR